MPYYRVAEPRAPLKSAVITAELVQRLMKQPGRSIAQLTISSTAATHFAGFVIPPRFKLCAREGERVVRDFFFVLVGGAVDGFVSYRDAPAVDWNAPTWEHILATYHPIEGEPLAAAERYVRELCGLLGVPLSADDPGPVAEKLAALPAPEAKLEALIALCEALDADPHGPEVSSLLDAARDPRGYLVTRGLVDRMTPAECRDFSWRLLFVEALCRLGVLACLDWKAGRDELAAAIRDLDPGASLDAAPPPSPDDMLFEHVLAARQALMGQGRRLIMLGDTGDSIAFALVPAGREAKVIALAIDLDLKPYPRSSA